MTILSENHIAHRKDFKSSELEHLKERKKPTLRKSIAKVFISVQYIKKFNKSRKTYFYAIKERIFDIKNEKLN